MTKNISSLFHKGAREIVELLEEKGYIEVEQSKFNIIVPHAFENQKFEEDIFSKEIGFVEFSEFKKHSKECQFTQEEINTNSVLKKLEAFKVEVK